MDKETIKEWLNDIATPTGISYSGDMTISEDNVKKIVGYVDDLEQQVKKQKEVIDEIEEYINSYQWYKLDCYKKTDIQNIINKSKED